MVIEIKQTLTEVFHSLKKGILDWIPNEILDLKDKFRTNEDNENIDIRTMSVSELTALINLIQKVQDGDHSLYKRPDSLFGYLRYIQHINGGQISDSGLCVMTSDFFNELVKENPLSEESLIGKLGDSYHKTISLFFDGGKPNVVKGIFKPNWINENKLKFIVC